MHVIEISWMFVMENCTVEFTCISAKLLFDLYWLDESHLSFVALIRVLQNSISGKETSSPEEVASTPV